MPSSFQLIGLDPAPFAPLFDLPENALRTHHARRVTVSAHPAFPAGSASRTRPSVRSCCCRTCVHHAVDSRSL
jgi:hypothetical protein